MKLSRLYPTYFTLPAAVIFTVFFVFPSVHGIYLGFTNWSIANELGRVAFVGLENYRLIFDPQLGIRRAIPNTLLISLTTTLLKNIIGLALAVVLVGPVRHRNVLRAVFFMPVILPPLIIGIVFTSVLKPSGGLLNNAFHWIGLGALARPWLAATATALASIIGVETWRQVGFAMAIYIAGLQVIPSELYESADMDGAGTVRKLISITLPQLVPAITINLILSLINGLKIFEIVFALTNSGPGGTTAVMMTEIFDQFSRGRYGLSAALGTVMFIIVTVLVFSVYRGVRRLGETTL